MCDEIVKMIQDVSRTIAWNTVPVHTNCMLAAEISCDMSGTLHV